MTGTPRSSERPVAFITGASRGMGAATAIALAEAGFDVAITARTVREGDGRQEAPWAGTVDNRVLPGSLEQVALRVEKSGAQALPVAMDLLDRDAVGNAADLTLDTFGRIDLLVNIGVYQGPGAMDYFLDTPIELFDRSLQADVVAPAILLQKFLPVMLAQGGGTVMNMTSYVVVNDPVAAGPVHGWSVAYAAAKAGIDRFGSVLNVELGERGITVLTVDPGFVSYGAALDEQRRNYPEAPVSPPEAIGAAIAWLATTPQARQLRDKRIYLPGLTQKRGLLPGWDGPGSVYQPQGANTDVNP
ncbi:short-chain dehydrogenase [Mycolicibacterium duvalii]|uniref:Beta-ketoacyl-ACP reductase n=1 Tax=Mycolicibacterium duvalii TaxID=39688 RepID=A0A7I7JZE2_9MYCO|nr:SDR family NAD(P)-dependent oxidoreductase [Mycolicibacterium duvalii]MCV7370879.1 SDR family NAD(P)-dependent oxidoreductase [Mycolicibacterium duvalii]PEG41306.1 short-chain dehydrogenase [Mycolicibacterium duvalii]BBX17133.1 beta-ketoacyl-ACP reductase [Mycolicibacterium duvalii]